MYRKTRRTVDFLYSAKGTIDLKEGREEIALHSASENAHVVSFAVMPCGGYFSWNTRAIANGAIIFYQLATLHHYDVI